MSPKALQNPKLKSSLRWMLTSACLLWIAWMLTEHPEALKRITQFDKNTLLLSSLLFVGYFIIYSLRLQSVIQVWSEKSVPYITFFRLVILGRLYNTIIPQLGLIYRGLALKRDYNISHSDYLNSQLAFTALDLVTNLLFALSVWAFFKFGWITALLLSGAYLFILIGIFALINTATKSFSIPDNNISRKILFLTQQWRHALNPRFALKFLLYSLGSMLLMTAIFSMYFTQLGAPLSPSSIVAFYAIYRMTFYLSITPGNIGIRELVIGVLGNQFGTPIETATLIGLSVRIQGYIILGLLGLSTLCLKKAD